MTQEEIKEKYAGCVTGCIPEENCSCPNEDCPLHQQCWSCVEWHRDHAGTPLPHCLRDIEEVQWRKREE